MHSSSVCWMEAAAQVLADGFHHYITQLFHSMRRILVSQSKAWEEWLQHLCCRTRPVGGHKQHDYTVVTAVALYGPVLLFILFILYLGAHDGFDFASRLHRASYCFCRDLCTFALAIFMLPLAKSLLVNEPSRPLQHQPWQLKNKHVLLGGFVPLSVPLVDIP